DSCGNGLVNDEVRQAIENSCSPINGGGVGEGCVNAFGAVAEASSVSATPPPRAPQSLTARERRL
ncbi:MAG: hypothetical protein KAU10_03340, partial [Dehalococcoidia bacterium]|nr:hypothetical protein [Dehalococcoidia bacterium]